MTACPSLRKAGTALPEFHKPDPCSQCADLTDITLRIYYNSESHLAVT
jgi:hypothetical protein